MGQSKSPRKTVSLNAKTKAKVANRTSKTDVKNAAAKRSNQKATNKTVNRSITKGAASATAILAQNSANKREVEMARIDASKEAFAFANSNRPTPTVEGAATTPNAGTPTNPFGW